MSQEESRFSRGMTMEDAIAVAENEVEELACDYAAECQCGFDGDLPDIYYALLLLVGHARKTTEGKKERGTT